MRSLADKMYLQGFRIYGVFSDKVRLAKGLAILVDDLIFGRAFMPRLVKLEIKL